MIHTLVFNDLHLAVQRVAGTTPDSARALRQYALDMLRNLLSLAEEVNHSEPVRVVFNGDLTDAFDTPLSDALDVYQVFDGFLRGQSNREVVVSLGNHDLSKDSSKLGTVAFIGTLLQLRYPGSFRLVAEPTTIGDGIHIIPHLTNQALFDMALESVPEGTQYLLLHCNFDNPFAGQQDHSLNITREQVRGLRDRGMTTVLGHEHQARSAFAGKLIIVGNQFPTSVADCLSHGEGQKDGTKYGLVITDAGPQPFKTWSVKDQHAAYLEVDWRELASVPDNAKFIRVTGSAEADESADAVKAISTLRQKHGAFVITNAVRVAQVDDTEDLAESVEDIRAVNVVDMLLGMLTEDQAAVVRGLMEQPQ